MCKTSLSTSFWLSHDRSIIVPVSVEGFSTNTAKSHQGRGGQQQTNNRKPSHPYAEVDRTDKCFYSSHCGRRLPSLSTDVCCATLYDVLAAEEVSEELDQDAASSGKKSEGDRRRQKARKLASTYINKKAFWLFVVGRFASITVLKDPRWVGFIRPIGQSWSRNIFLSHTYGVLLYLWPIRRNATDYIQCSNCQQSKILLIICAN